MTSRSGTDVTEAWASSAPAPCRPLPASERSRPRPWSPGSGHRCPRSESIRKGRRRARGTPCSSAALVCACATVARPRLCLARRLSERLSSTTNASSTRSRARGCRSADSPRPRAARSAAAHQSPHRRQLRGEDARSARQGARASPRASGGPEHLRRRSRAPHLPAGLAEDVAIDGRLFTFRMPHVGEDTGLRFGTSNECWLFRCCDAEVAEPIADVAAAST